MRLPTQERKPEAVTEPRKAHQQSDKELVAAGDSMHLFPQFPSQWLQVTSYVDRCWPVTQDPEEEVCLGAWPFTGHTYFCLALQGCHLPLSSCIFSQVLGEYFWGRRYNEQAVLEKDYHVVPVFHDETFSASESTNKDKLYITCLFLSLHVLKIAL